VPDDRDRGRQILQGLLGLELLGIAAPLVDIGAAIAELDAAPDPIEERRRDGRRGPSGS
jgi:hypothetical protein